MTKALEVATATPAKFDRFIARVEPGTNSSSPAASQLRDRMQAKLVDLQTRLNQNMPGTPFGFGRVDAFGHIFTHVLAQDLKIPANAAPPYAPAVKAPVSYPFLWDTPQHNVVQWNGSAPNTKFLKLGPLGRNVGEVLGVFGELQVVPGSKIPLLPFFTKPPQFISSARIDNLNALEGQVKQLWSPVWPKRCLPLADTATLTRGRKVYDDYCVKCHTLLTNPERKNEKREITAVLKPLPEISTDPTMAMNFVARTARTGPLEGFPDVIKLREFGPEATGDEILFAVANGVILHGIVNRPGEIINVAGFLVDLRSEFAKLREALDAARVPRYKARPLNGIWATAPYLHNGSVPTLWDLLSPPKDRPAAFYVGSRVFDPRKVGLVSTEAPGMFRYDTSPKGNWRNGHEFGTALPANQKKDLLEFLKTL